ncbi:type II secretion system protein GspJ [Vibrio metschnikovii]
MVDALLSTGEWSEQWESERRLPEAVSVRLILKDYGEIERVYLLTGASLGRADGAS